MVKRLIASTIILIFVFISISCQQGISPLASQAVGTEQATESMSTEGAVQTGLNTAPAGLRKTGKNEPGVHRNQEGKTDRRAHSRVQEIDVGAENEASLLAEGYFISGQGESGLNTAQSNQAAKINGESQDEEPSDQLWIQIQPAKWNVTWKISQGLVTVRIKGEGNAEINTETLRLVGPDGAATNAPVRAHLGEFALVVKFLKSEAIAIVPDPKRGDSCAIEVTGQYKDDSDLKLLPVTVYIIGRKPEEPELSLVIRPKNWNLAWINGGEEEVLARIFGDGFRDIVKESVKMDFPEGTAGPVDPIPDTAQSSGYSFKVKFLQSQVIRLIPDPQRGESYDIHVMGKLEDGSPFDVNYAITIVGEKNSSELSLKIRPKSWNLAWLKKSDADAGMVTAQIKGERFDDILPGSIAMQGTNGGAAIAPVATELEDNCLIVKFLQNQAVGLILDPQPRTDYIIFVSGSFSGKGTFNLSDNITLKGKK